jgi:outer membrane receptor protein involved in Fe transport
VSLRLGVEAYSDYFVTQDNTLKGGAYQLVNLGVTWRPATWRLDQINLAVTNLLDQEYYYLFGVNDRATLAVPGEPVQFRISADWRF